MLSCRLLLRGFSYHKCIATLYARLKATRNNIARMRARVCVLCTIVILSMGFFSRIDQILDTLDGTFRRSIERLQHLSTFLTDRVLSICHLKNPCFFFPSSLSLSLSLSWIHRESVCLRSERLRQIIDESFARRRCESRMIER